LGELKRRWMEIKKMAKREVLPNSSGDKQSIICQITSGSLDNAVEATHFINNTLTNPVTP